MSFGSILTLNFKSNLIINWQLIVFQIIIKSDLNSSLKSLGPCLLRLESRFLNRVLTFLCTWGICEDRCVCDGVETASDIVTDPATATGRDTSEISFISI